MYFIKFLDNIDKQDVSCLARLIQNVLALNVRSESKIVYQLYWCASLDIFYISKANVSNGNN